MTPKAHDKLVVVNPANLKIVRELKVHDGSDMAYFEKRARRAQFVWELKTFDGRLQLLRELKSYIKRNHQDFTSVIQSETGKVWPDAMVDVISAVAEINNIEKNGAKRVREFEEPVGTHLFLRNKITTVPRTPKGVIGVISPWNLPLAIPAADIFPAIFRGNAVIWKPSEYTPLTALKLQEAMREVGFPEGLLQVAVGYGETGAALCHAADCIVFTGSCKTGELVRDVCTKLRKSFHLEMGGKAPAIILNDASVERAAYGLLYGAFSNNGHYCKAFEMAFVHKSIYDDVANRLLRLVNSLEPGKDYGPIITKFQLERVEKQVEQAKAYGAYIATGGQRVTGLAGYWYRPTVILDATDKMDVLTQETFGPVLPIIPFDDAEEAISFAGRSHLGLNSSIFTQDKKKFTNLALRMSRSFGNIVGNDAMINWFIAEAPQCGRKQSVNESCGLERHGRSGDDRFDDPNTIVWHDHPFFYLPFFKNKEPWWLPYDKFTEIALKTFLYAF